MGPTAGLDDLKKIYYFVPAGIRSPDSPFHWKQFGMKLACAGAVAHVQTVRGVLQGRS